MRSVVVFCKIISSFLATIAPEVTDVAIIGAGPSGLAAGVKLLESGINNILILEAEDRIGGRIHTVDFEGRNIDLGAEWCHGQKGNIVYETLENQKLLYLLQSEDFSPDFYLSTRQKLSNHFSEGFFDSAEYAYPETGDPVALKGEKSLGALVLKRYDESVARIFKNEPENLRLAQMAKEYLRYSVLSNEGALDWFDIAADEDFVVTKGDQELGWKGYGYGKFLDVLTKKFPNPKEQVPIDDKIRLNKQVTNIIVNENDVSILCADNSMFKAKYVLFTPSLGVLKEKSKTLFSPELPKQKMDAIERIGFGPVMKVFLKYDRAWWGNLTAFNFIWTGRDRRESRKNFPDGPATSNGESWIVTHFSILAMPQSKILCVWYTGDLVPAIEVMDENVLKEGIMYTLKLFLGHLIYVPEPQKIIRTGWYNNPNFRGSYSYSSVNSTTEDIRNLQAPVKNAKGDNVLYFAGEATSILHHSTVHGAIETGFREANNLLYDNYAHIAL